MATVHDDREGWLPGALHRPVSDAQPAGANDATPTGDGNELAAFVLSNTTVDRDAHVRDALQHEIDYRRQRRAAIFTWANSVLIAVTGGVVALQVQGDQPISTSQRLVLSLAVLVVGAFSSLWWRDHRLQGAAARKKLDDVNAGLAPELRYESDRLSNLVGGFYAILLMMVITLTAIWVPVQ